MTSATEDSGVPDVTVAPVLEWIAGLLVAPPTGNQIARLRSPEGCAVLGATAVEWSSHTAMLQIRRALDPCKPADTVAADLSVSYTRLFEGVCGIPAVSLYESTYAVAACEAPAPPRLYGRAAGEMDALLRQFRMGLGATREASDHISIELALLAALLRKGHIGGEGLMRARLAGWMPALIDGCIALDPDGFYGGLARLLGNLNLLEAPGPDGQPHLVSVIDGQDGSHHVE